MSRKHKEHLIKDVKTGSIAEELNIEPGDVLIEIDGNILEDVFDYHYMVNSDYLVMVIRKPDGEEWELEIEKDFDEDIGIEFEQGLMDDYRSCTNKCIFCFIDQMPKGMRETLYFKDDDSRLSFLQGNYITLTNMKDKDIDRIIKFHLCPINISVQTTNPELRCMMLHNRFAGDALKKIDRLAENCIEMNGQIVLCKGVNDGEELRRSIEDLKKYLPHMRSVSVVPAGLTKYREGLYPLELFTKEDAEKTIELIESYQQECFEEYGLHFIHASDEWYILAERDFPQEERYDGYIQLENGVGMMRLLREEFREALNATEADDKERKLSIATGKLSYPEIRKLADMVQNKFINTKINVYAIENEFFGNTITVSGLLTGQDIVKQLTEVQQKGECLGERLLLPANMLRAGEDVFLDDMHLSELSKSLNVRVQVPQNTGESLLYNMLNEADDRCTNNSNFVYITCYEQNSKGCFAKSVNDKEERYE